LLFFDVIATAAFSPFLLFSSFFSSVPAISLPIDFACVLRALVFHVHSCRARAQSARRDPAAPLSALRRSFGNPQMKWKIMFQVDFEIRRTMLENSITD
jgi:hypothetical protein